MTIIIIGPPSSPGKPEAIDVNADSLTIFWKAPENDGNSPIAEYILEYQEITEKKYDSCTYQLNIFNISNVFI